MAEPVKGVTVIVPTIGRPSLEGCLNSFAGQLDRDDEVIVIADGEQPHIEFLVSQIATQHPKPVWTYLWSEPLGEWGHPLRNLVLDTYIETSHVWTIDDDDVAYPDTIAHLKRYLDDDYVIFRMHFGEGHPAAGITCWRYQQLMHGDLGTPMIFARHGTARFGHHYSGDYDYAVALKEQYGDPIWAPEIVALIRPGETDV